MSKQLDFDEFNFLDKKRSPLDWRNPKDDHAPDCRIIVNGTNEYSIHLEVACRSSKFFFDVAAGRYSTPKNQNQICLQSPAGICS